MRTTLLQAALALGLTFASAQADARTVRDEPYALDTTWNAAVRMVRVDFGFTIDERDRDLGYFTFQYREGRRTVPGSVEVLRSEVDGRQGTRVIVQIPSMPAYVESMMLQRLARKLRSEFGEAPPPPSRRPADRPAGEAPPDAAHPHEPAAPTPPAQPSQPAQPAQPTAQPSQPAVPAATLTAGRWEAPARVRYIDDFDD
jgi:hypothetical protein